MKQISITDLPEEKIRAKLRGKDDYKKIHFAGTEREFFIGGVSYEFAEEEDIDFSEVSLVLDAKDAEMLEGETPSGETVTRFSTALAWFLYIGFKPFGCDLSPAEIKLEVGTMEEDEMIRLYAEISPEGMEAAEEEMGNPGAGAPRPGPPKRGSGNGATASAATTGVS